MRRAFTCITSLAFGTLLVTPNLAAKQTSQSAAATTASPTYDVVSIRENKSGSLKGGAGPTADGFRATNVTAAGLLTTAYKFRNETIFGLPGWARSVHFDIEAKITDPDREAVKELSDEQRRAMMVALLKDRFHLSAHIETRTLPVYDLVVAKNGPKLKEAKSVTGNGEQHSNLQISGTKLTAVGFPIGALAPTLNGDVGRTVVDKTGLTGIYDFTLKWRPVNATADNNDPDLFTALQEQLGLKLVPSKGPVPTLIIDHIERPTEN